MKSVLFTCGDSSEVYMSSFVFFPPTSDSCDFMVKSDFLGNVTLSEH